jgi:hypothetical protein
VRTAGVVSISQEDPTRVAVANAIYACSQLNINWARIVTKKTSSEDEVILGQTYLL